MKKLISTITLFTILSLTATLSSAEETKPQVRLTTNMGDITIELEPEKAPLTVENFLNYVREGFYDGTIFHRVIGNFMIQGGGFTEEYGKKSTHAPIKNEADNGLRNARGTIAMARTGNPHSATAQFFINVVDNGFLNYTSKSTRGWGYAVFGQVVEGMDTVDKIRNVRTGPGGPFRQDAPVDKVIIEKAYIITDMPEPEEQQSSSEDSAS